MTPDARRSEESERLFFVRVMRTGSTTLTRRMKQHLGEEAVYPARRHNDGVNAALSVPLLLAHWRDERDRIRAIAGHFPLATVELLDAPFTTLTILRDPVARTLSQLRRFRDVIPEYAGVDLETIYEDPWRFHNNLHNHMVRMFSLTADEVLETGMWTRIEHTRARLERAKERLESVDVVGIQERFDDLCSAVATRFGWDLGEPTRAATTSGPPVDDSFEERIAHDNALDVELYEYACQLVDRRAGRG